MYNKFNDYNKFCKVNKELSNPLTYILNDWKTSTMLHGSGVGRKFGRYSKKAQQFMSDKCSRNWDGYCEISSKDKDTSHPNMLETGYDDNKHFTAGERLIRNSFKKKFMFQLKGCKIDWEVYDPTDVDSHIVSNLVSTCPGKECIINYCPSIEQINNMNNDLLVKKVIKNPKIVLDILINMYYTIINYKINDMNFMNAIQNSLLSKEIFSKEWFKKIIEKKSSAILKLTKTLR